MVFFQSLNIIFSTGLTVFVLHLIDVELLVPGQDCIDRTRNKMFLLNWNK